MKNKNQEKRAYISEENAEIYYKKMLKDYKLETDWGEKISTLKKLMEKKILTEVTEFNQFEGQIEGQRKWLLDNQINRYNNNNSGFIEEKIVSGCIHLVKNRNAAEHQPDDMFYGEYIGNFSSLALTIKFFSGIDIPEEIRSILEQGKIQNKKITNPKNINNNDWSGYYYVNTGISDDPERSWEYNKKYNFISGGNKIVHINRIRTLRKGDKIFAFTSRKGYVGYGIVEEEAVIVKEYMINGKKMINELPKNHKWTKKKDPDADEWIVRVKWVKKFKENEAKWKKDLFSNPNTVCKLYKKHEETLEFLKKEFEIKD